MAANTGKNKRIPVKFIRDRAKRGYIKQPNCAICDTTEELELHHLASVTLMLNAWVQRTGIDVSTDERIIAVRDDFILAHHKEMYDDVYTLCNTHHMNLHKVFGKAPPLGSAEKQRDWIEKQRSKIVDGVILPPKERIKDASQRVSFAEFC